MKKKCCSLDLTPTNCSMLKIVVLWRGNILQLTVPCPAVIGLLRSQVRFLAPSKTNHVKFYNSLLYFSQNTMIHSILKSISKTASVTAEKYTRCLLSIFHNKNICRV